MFGYVNINKAELKVKDFFKYKAYYCGLCKTLQKKYGKIGQMTLSYDMTFLIILLTSLYETDTKHDQNRCMIHPVKKHDTLVNEVTEYVADMNIALSYHHFIDDWQDEKSAIGLAGAKALKRYYKKISLQYPIQCNEISIYLQRLSEYEKCDERNIDLVAGCFGDLMSALFAFQDDSWKESLRKIGFFLGKFIYILDAYDDVEKDIKNKSYNPLIFDIEKDSFDEDCRRIMIMMMAECTREFEKLPCLLDIDILRNILYDGVWTKFEQIKAKRNKQEGTKA